MRFVEDYWQDFIDFGFIKTETNGRIDYTLPKEIGSGGFSILGDPKGAMGIISNCSLKKPFVIVECVHEKMIEIGQYYEGSVSLYEKKAENITFEYGLNAYVNHPYFFYGYKKIEENIPLINVGFAFRKNFFDKLPISLPEKFWDLAAASLNSGLLNIPKITFICNQLKECTLTGDALKLYIEGKALEVFALLFEYITEHDKKQTLHLSDTDKQTLALIKKHLEDHYSGNTTITELTKRFALNQQKIVTGFKELYGVTINGYRKRLRMSKALELLSNTELPIVEIAKSVGYYGDGFFQRAFKDIYGVTPIEIRNDLK